MKLVGPLLAFSCLLPSPSALAARLVVGPGAAVKSIQVGITQVQPGDSVMVQAGYYYERLQLRDRVSVIALGVGSVIVDAEADGSVVTAIGVGSATNLYGIIFEHGSAYSGGGLRCVASSLKFVDCLFIANSAVLGGGAYLRDGSAASFSRCTFSNNVAEAGGGMYLEYSKATVDASNLTGNDASDGGAISANHGAEAVFTFTTVFENRTRRGSTVECNASSPSFINCTVASNADDTQAGGAFGLRGSGTRIERCIVALNAGPAVTCDGFSSPWIGCNDFFANTTNSICAGDQATNVSIDPLFCNVSADDYKLRSDSPIVGTSCGVLGALSITCPAAPIETAVERATWSHIKRLYRD